MFARCYVQDAGLGISNRRTVDVDAADVARTPERPFQPKVIVPMQGGIEERPDLVI